MVLRFIGKTFIALGIFILLFLGYQLWGTNFVTEQHQKKLNAGLKRAWAETPPSAATTKPELGDAFAIIEIPKLEVEEAVVEGVEVRDLKKGPGHFPGTALPGEKGNVVISGHRTTYGAPFYRLDELKKGDDIRLVDRTGRHRYRVLELKVVKPTDLSVIVPTTEARLTLTTCEPRFSARLRLIVVAELAGVAKESSIR